jgi:hypothetical protein
MVKLIDSGQVMRGMRDPRLRAGRNRGRIWEFPGNPPVSLPIGDASLVTARRLFILVNCLD